MIKTEEYMSTPVVTVSPDDTVENIAKLMDAKNIGSLPVVEDEKVVGILTERDVMRKVIAKELDIKSVKAKDIMTSDVITVKESASLMEVASLMKEHIMRRIVVLRDGEAVGIITSRDLVELLV